MSAMMDIEQRKALASFLDGFRPARGADRVRRHLLHLDLHELFTFAIYHPEKVVAG